MRHETVEIPPRMQRVEAHGRLEVARSAGRTRVSRLYQEGAAKIRLPDRRFDPLEAVLINTAGGLTGGDRVAWEIAAAAGSAAVITTQACEKIYRAGHGEARLDARLSIGPGARLAWLPQETILFETSALSRRIEVDLAAGSRLLMVEATLFGRLARGERIARATMRDFLRIRCDGGLVHAEAFAAGPGAAAQLAHRAGGGGAAAMASVLLIGDDAGNLLAPARELIGESGGASFWRVGGTGKLLARLLDKDGYCLRRRLVPLLELLNGEAALPKVWSL